MTKNFNNYRFFIPIVGATMLLTSCSSSFSFVKKTSEIDHTKLLIGSYPTIESDVAGKFENIMYLHFYSNNENYDIDNYSNYDKAINLTESPLVKIDDTITSNNGNVLTFYDVSNIFQNLTNYENIDDYFSDGNKLDLFFSYGEIDDGTYITLRTSITESGYYFFSTISTTPEDNERKQPQYTHARIYCEKIYFFNPLTGKYEESL